MDIPDGTDRSATVSSERQPESIAVGLEMGYYDQPRAATQKRSRPNSAVAQIRPANTCKRVKRNSSAQEWRCSPRPSDSDYYESVPGRDSVSRADGHWPSTPGEEKIRLSELKQHDFRGRAENYRNNHYESAGTVVHPSGLFRLLSVGPKPVEETSKSIHRGTRKEVHKPLTPVVHLL